jgi:hypothetical protein
MKHLVTIDVETIWGSQNGNYNMYTHKCSYITFERNGNPNDFLLFIGSVFGSLNAIQIGL